MKTGTIRLATRSLRAGGPALLAPFTALALGVALMATTLLGLAAATALPPGDDRTALIAQLGTGCGVAVFTAGFVVASSYAYAVARRRRELGLLRLAGATRGQVRRSVLAEALLLGVLAAATGTALARSGVPLFARLLTAAGLAPAGFRIGTPGWPLVTAFCTGPLVALTAVAVAAWRAGRVRPLEALREADVDTRVMTPGRWLCGLALLGTAAALTGTALFGDPADLLHRKTYTLQPMVLISATALLAPALARPPLRLLTARRSRLLPRLVRGGALTGVRRTGAIAAPVLLAVALAGSLTGAPATVAAARAAEARDRTAADHLLVPRDGDGDALAAALRGLPGAVVSPTATTRLAVLEPDGTAVRAEARAVTDPAALATVTRLPVAAGDVTALDDDSVVLAEEWGHPTVGDRVPVVLADGTRRTLRVAAVLRDGTGDNPVHLTPRNAPGARTDRIDLRLAPELEGRLRDLAQAHGATLATRADWLAAQYPTDDPTRIRRIVGVLGLALLYTAIALAHAVLTATADRRRELAQLRLAGATRTQVVALVATETLAVTTTGALLGAAVTAAGLAAMQTALRLLGTAAPLTVPWQALGATTLLCTAIAVTCASAAALHAVRGRPVAALR
ncbi:FtsX-like permease family protein [Kitasatospora sp. CB02891]|uniref:ABC transporter permease n=1 Tax=Kitasatospora sp. CB02891 TaxID=2020329 RepID=UPI000C2750E0|nr:FtsX-like permease family protein [Kitasatospora sp. CB02891]PJN21626.1 ABC transporter permease [Kitasatospora sp. CB02891]